MQFAWIFHEILKYCFLQGNLRKTLKPFLKNKNFLLQGSDLCEFFFKVFTFFKGYFIDL